MALGSPAEVETLVKRAKVWAKERLLDLDLASEGKYLPLSCIVSRYVQSILDEQEDRSHEEKSRLLAICGNPVAKVISTQLMSIFGSRLRQVSSLV